MPSVVELGLFSSDPAASRSFLRSLFPAIDRGDSAGRVRYAHRPGTPSATGEGLPAFWKFSVFCHDLGATRDRVIAAGVAVNEPVQFGDIGYLCHFVEPGGNEVELLQRTFHGKPRLATEAPDILGLITLRISDPAASARFYQEALGMRLLSIMSVDDGRPDPFDLYFYAFGAEDPPDADPTGVANREWLYQRPYTLIELQHYRSPIPALAAASHLAQITLTADALDPFADRLAAAGVAVERVDGAVEFTSPDGHRFVTAATPVEAV